jgi:phage shock protein C
MKKVYRSNDDKIIGGVLGGFAEYMNIDATILRVLYVIFSIMSAAFPGVLIYIACLIIIPKAPEGAPQSFNNQGSWYNPQTGRYENGYNQYNASNPSYGQYNGQFNQNGQYNGQYNPNNGQFNQNNGAPFTPPPAQENQDKPQS